MLGRAVGIVIIAAIQKATTDVMDSSFRTNLQAQVCFRVANRLMAASMFGSTEDLKLDPIALRRQRSEVRILSGAPPNFWVRSGHMGYGLFRRHG